MDTTDWLLGSEPAIRWQALRDVKDTSPAEIAAERARVPREGVGAQILACQGSDGAWHRAEAPDWLPTLFTMQLLRATGVNPAESAVQSAVTRLNAGFRWAEEFGAKPFFEGEVEPCINGGVLALGAYFGRPSESLARRLVTEQLADGGWNCEAPESKRSSYHTTICVLEGLLEYERAVGSGAGLVTEIEAARRRGEEYLLERGLFRRKSTGEVASAAFLKFAYPPRSRTTGTTTCCARWTTSGRPGHSPMRAWLRRCGWWRAGGSRTGDGSWMIRTMRRWPFRSGRQCVARAGGTRCGRCEC